MPTVRTRIIYTLDRVFQDQELKINGSLFLRLVLSFLGMLLYPFYWLTIKRKSDGKARKYGLTKDSH